MEQPLAGFGIAVTRPIDQAQKLNAGIVALGGTAISFPLIAITPLPDYTTFNTTISLLNTMDWAIFISSNAVEHAMPRLMQYWPQQPKSLFFAAIGPATAQVLTAYGVPNVLIPNNRFDSESLLALPQMQAMQGKKVMIFRGIGGREILADTLKARGATVVFAECYQRVNPIKDCCQLDYLWQNNQCHAIVVTSSEAMHHLLHMTNNGKDTWLQQVKICVNHARIAESTLSTGLQVFVAEAPGEQAMLACLQMSLRHKGAIN